MITAGTNTGPLLGHQWGGDWRLNQGSRGRCRSIVEKSVNCVCVCVCESQIYEIILKLQGSTMMRPNHEFFCSVALLPGFRIWVEMICNIQQEGVGFVFLPRPASLFRASMLPCAEAALGESVVPLADAGGKKPMCAAVLLADAGGEKPRGAAEGHVPRGGESGWVGHWTRRKNDPGGVPTGIQNHDLWRGRQVRFRYSIFRHGCIPAFKTTTSDFHRLCLGGPLLLVAPTTQTDSMGVDPWRRACRLQHQRKCDVGVTCVSGMLLPVCSPKSRTANLYEVPPSEKVSGPSLVVLEPVLACAAPPRCLGGRTGGG